MTLHYVVYIDTRSFTHAHSILYDEANQMQVDLVYVVIITEFLLIWLAPLVFENVEIRQQLWADN